MQMHVTWIQNYNFRFKYPDRDFLLCYIYIPINLRIVELFNVCLLVSWIIAQ
jgi:hypothetical protein